MASSRYDKLITLEKVERQTVPGGLLEVWGKVRTFQGSCEYYTQDRFDENGQVAGESETYWILRTRNDIIHTTRSVGRFRYRCRIRGQDSIFYPKSMPVFKGNEWRHDLSEEEDTPEIEAGNLRGPAMEPF